jgi:hypothetical protein
MSYSKADVEFHSDGMGRGRKPAVNVKVYGSTWDVKLPMHLGSSYPAGHPELIEESWTHPLFTHEWIDENVSSETLDSFFWQACRDGFEWIESNAQDIFDSDVKVYSEGGSGGWAVPDGLPDFDSWDAIMLGKWRRFERWAKAEAEDVPRAIVDNVYHCLFLPWLDEQDESAEGDTPKIEEALASM